MADFPQPSSTKKGGCSECNPNSKDKDASAGGSSKKKNICLKCNSKLEVAGACSFSYQTNGEKKTQSLQRRFMEKIKTTLQRYTLPTAWLENRREARLQKRTSQQIDKQLRIEKKLYRDMQSALIIDAKRTGIMATVPKLQIYQQEDKLAHYGILLLGTEAAGKSTIIKQMRILHGNGFSHQEKKQIITNIKENIMDAILVISHAMTILTPTVTLQHPENNAKIEYLQKQARQFNYDYPPEFFENITALWRDEGIQATYQRKNEYQLIDNAKYFLNKIDVIKHTDYIPTEQDILNCYQKFENNYENFFQINNIMFDMFDIRRIRWERRRYLHYLNGTITLVYVVASDSYDTVLSEFDYTTKQNRLKESLYLFETIWKIRWYSTTSVILFLNKQDLLREKILTGKSKLEEHFPDFSDYKAPLNVQFQSSEHPEVTRAKYFIRDQFLNIFTASTNKFQFCYPHFTCAIDTEHIKQVFNDCYNIIQYINLCGFNIL